VAGARKILARGELLTYGRRIRALREDKGWTQEKLAEEAGLPRPVIGFIERAERDTGVSHVWPIAKALGVKASALFED
jgi:transcriptional regulator with XRE-family HTH domain